jgi:hypothetical protein
MYVNPIEILGLSNATDTKSIDNDVVKKAKRKLFADIDLSDNGLFEYYGLQLTKGNCEKAIDELTNNDFKEFYLYLANNISLNEFLASGKEDVFKNFKQDSIFKLPEFVNFISQYFAPKFDKALLTAFENDNVDLTKAILNTSILIAQGDLNSAYKSVSNNIQNKIAEINEITKDIRNEESDYDEDDIEDIVQIVKEYFPANTLNCLPQYFQSQILIIAKSINYLSNSIWDAFDTTQVPNDLTEYLLTLNIDGLDRPTFENNFKIISKKNNERIEQAKNAPTLKIWAPILINLKGVATKIKNQEIGPILAFRSVLAVSFDKLNELPSFANEIRYSIAFVLRDISVSMWNEHKDIETAIKTLTIAAKIKLVASDEKKIKDDLAALKSIESKKKQQGAPMNKPPTLWPDEIFGPKMFGKTVYFAVFSIPILPLSRYNCESTSTGYRFYGKLKLQIWQNIWKWGLIGGILIWIIIAMNSNENSTNYPQNSTDNYTSPITSNENTDNTSNSTNEEIAPITSQYIGNQLEDGASPLTGCFGKGIYSGNATLTIKNGGNSDAIICLYSIDDNRTIRNEYVRKNSTFTMSNIAQGFYKIRIFYGNDWNPELENSCGTKGSFEKDINFSEFDGTDYFEDSGGSYTVATITLYNVAGGNASSSSIDQSKFFGK